MAVTEEVFIGLGSNLGDSAQILQRAWSRLAELPGITAVDLSPPFISSPVGMTSHHWFTNAVGRLSVTCTPYDLLDNLLQVEYLFGRQRGQALKGYQDRTLDLDIIYFGSMIIDSPRLTVPHPRRLERLFVLAPLAAIAPDFVDPETCYRIDKMLGDLLEKIRQARIPNQEITQVEWNSILPPLD